MIDKANGIYGMYTYAKHVSSYWIQMEIMQISSKIKLCLLTLIELCIHINTYFAYYTSKVYFMYS